MNAFPDGGAFPDYIAAANITEYPRIYEWENQAFDRDGKVWTALQRVAGWDGRTVVDLGCGTGYWLPGYARTAAQAVGLEPHPGLRAAARRRAEGLERVQVVAGSAEHTGLPDASADVVHARFAYFFGPACEPGLAECLRVLRPGGVLVAVDHNYDAGEFAPLLRAGLVSSGRVDPSAVAAFWRRAGARQVDVLARLAFASSDQLAAVLHIELPASVADEWLARHRGATAISYGVRLWVVRKDIDVFGAASDVVRLTAWVRGRVQGVGFRWWVRVRATELGLAGYATNLEDRRVEVVVEGPRTTCEALVEELRGGQAPGRVDGVVFRTAAARGDLRGFRER